ncbi:MAG TPA: TatD family hydrolase [Methanocorpusculum sp.]|nr:TatD family hydrolase [Methanocorpusculum sp.]
MQAAFPILDDHFHINQRKGVGPTVIKEFMRSGGTHIILVSLPSWSYDIFPKQPKDFRKIFDELLKTSKTILSKGCICYPICGVHPAEIGKLCDRMSLREAETLMCGALEVAAEYVSEGHAIGLKSGRPHYPVEPEIWEASNRVLSHALTLARELDCALQIHSERGTCADIVKIAKKVGTNPAHIVKHFATCDTPLHPSITVRESFLTTWFQDKREFTLESDYMDDCSRPGAVNGPRSVPRRMQKLLQEGAVTHEDMWRVHSAIPEKIYGVSFCV